MDGYERERERRRKGYSISTTFVVVVVVVRVILPHHPSRCRRKGMAIEEGRNRIRDKIYIDRWMCMIQPKEDKEDRVIVM